MKRKFLEDLGLEKEAVDKIMAENGNDINAAKGELTSVQDQLKTAQATIAERDTQLQTLSTSAGDNEALKLQIAQLQEENHKKDAEYQEQLKDIKLTNAIKLAIADKAQDCDLVAGLFDKSKLIMGDDGNITGLDDQISALKESKKFLFKEEKAEPAKPAPGFRIGAGNSTTGSTHPGQSEQKLSMKEAIAAKIQSQTGQVKE